MESEPSSQRAREALPSGLDDLLQPSLAEAARPVAIYSVRAGFFVAFFGGGLAVLLFSALNSRRLGRLAQDAWVYALGVVFFGAMITAYAQGFEFEFLSGMGDPNRTKRYVSRLLSLMYFGIIFLLHRRFYKAAELSGEDPPNPWPAGLGAVAASTALAYVVALVISRVPG